jgi:hypothetical protein
MSLHGNDNNLRIGAINVHGIQDMVAKAEQSGNYAWISLGTTNGKHFAARLNLFADGTAPLHQLERIARVINDALHELRDPSYEGSEDLSRVSAGIWC